MAFAHHSRSVEPAELEAKIAVCGDPGVGKSTLLRAEVDRGLDGSVLPAGSPHVVNTRTKRYTVDGRRWHVHYVDVPGSERFKQAANWYTAGAAAAVYVVSLHSRPSLEHVREWAARTAGARRCGGTGGFVIGNHTQASSPLVKMAEVHEMAARLGMRAFETSTVNGSGIAAAFRDIVDAVAADVPAVPEPGALVHKGVKVCQSLVTDPEFQRSLYVYDTA